MTDFFSELNTVMNYFALVDQCQNLGRNGYSLDFSMKSMNIIEKLIKQELQFKQTRELFNQLAQIYFPTRKQNV